MTNGHAPVGSKSLLEEAWRSHRAGDHARAERLYKHILQREPRNFDALYRLGFLFGEHGQFEEAESLMGEAIKLKPGASDAYFLRGSALLSLGRLDDALLCFDSTLALNPDFPEALLNRAAALFRLRRYAQAGEDYNRLLRLVPDYPYALGHRLSCRLQVCDWSSRDEDIGAIAAGLGLGKRVVAPFDTKALSLSADEELRAARIWAGDKAPVAAALCNEGNPYRHDRIRVAYVATDFGEDPVSSLIAGVIEHHDRERFEITGVSFHGRGNHGLEGRFRRAFERYIDVSEFDDAKIASLLRDREIDIAVDLAGFTEGCRPGIFAMGAAPVQANYLGFPGTLGADYVDYILADKTVIPEGQRRFYSEKVVYLPDSYQCNDSTRRITDRSPSRAEAGLPAQGFVFASFNNTYKLTPGMFDVWMRLLYAVEGSVLWLPKSNALAIRNLTREAQARRVSGDRLVFAPFLPAAEDHLARLRLADLSLDTLPYNAHTTASDALWVGLPVLTCVGSAFAGRVAASLLQAVGLPEMVTHSLGEYEALALKLAREPAALSAVKAKLAQNRGTHPLFDTVRFTRHLEAAYRTMWERSCRGQAPASFEIGPQA